MMEKITIKKADYVILENNIPFYYSWSDRTYKFNNKRISYVVSESPDLFSKEIKRTYIVFYNDKMIYHGKDAVQAITIFMALYRALS